MGSACVSEKKKREYFDHFAKLFDSFDFRLNPSDEFTFIMRAKRELTGGYGPDEFLQKIFNGYRRFLIETCIKVNLVKNRDHSEPLIAKLTPPPLVDEMWQLAILYTEKYRELCKHMIGSVIHREPQPRIDGFKSLFKGVWVDYNTKMWMWDRDYTVWIYNRDIVGVVTRVYDYVMSFKTNDRIHLQTSEMNTYLTRIRSFVETVVAYKDLNRPETHIPDNHSYFNPEKTESVDLIFSKIQSLLPNNIRSLLYLKYCTSSISDSYINEYIRFMVLIYYSKNTLTPSEEVDQVWHLHQSLTLEYERFCTSIFGKLIIHTPTAGGKSDEVKFKEYYYQTLEFYKFIFKQSPINGIWPPVEVRFDPNYFIGSWISLVRIFQSVVRIVEVNKATVPQNLYIDTMNCYYAWTGRNLFNKKMFKINMKKTAQYRDGYSSGTYWVAGGCALIIGTGCGGGCGGGCGNSGCGGGSGCGGSGCGGSGCGGSGCGGSGCGGSGCGGGGCGGGGCGGGGCGGGGCGGGD